MWPRSRRPALPEQVTAVLEQGERPLAQCRTTEDGWVVGTAQALLILTDRGTARIPWEQIEGARWDGDAERLLVTEVGDFGKVRPRHELAVVEPGRLLQLVRERVTASVVVQRRVVVPGRGGLLVVGRRSPAGGGAVTWAFEYDAGTDPADDVVAVAARRGLALAEEELGI